MKKSDNSIQIAMTVAGSDSGGGAGVQGDLKTFSYFDVYGTSAITALTAQNGEGVSGVSGVDPAFVSEQIETVYNGMNVTAVKTGMLFSGQVVSAVVESFKRVNARNIVVDPVMLSSGGAPLLDEDGIAKMVKLLFPLATLVTPNIPEAEELAGVKIDSLDSMKRAAVKIKGLGPESVMVTGGHLAGKDLFDLLLSHDEFTLHEKREVVTDHTHGTGCALSAAITAGLAKGLHIQTAVAEAEKYIDVAIRNSFPIGKGRGPVNHLPC